MENQLLHNNYKNGRYLSPETRGVKIKDIPSILCLLKSGTIKMAES